MITLSPRRTCARPGLGAITLRALVIAALLLALFPTRAYALRCGVDRWDVKTGGDPDAAQINLGSATVKSITEMRSLPAPGSRPTESRVAPTETTVFTIDALLSKYKWENSNTSGDSDYHLVIEDANGTSMVAEIPNPVCVSSSSPLAAQIAVARQVFDARFTATGSFLPVQPPMPVRVTGVGFFDKPSHGSGSAPNGIELHPVLDIAFNPSGSPPSAAPSPSAPPSVPPSAPPTSTGTPGGSGAPQPRQLLGNAGFEDGDAAPWTTTGGVVTRSKTFKPHGGTYYAWLGGYGKVHMDTLQQTVTVPASATRVTLSYYILVNTEETTATDRYDEMMLEIQTTNRIVLQGVITYSNLDAGSGYEKHTVNLTGFKGQTIVIVFTALEDGSLSTSWILDDFALTVE